MTLQEYVSAALADVVNGVSNAGAAIKGKEGVVPYAGSGRRETQDVEFDLPLIVDAGKLQVAQGSIEVTGRIKFKVTVQFS